MRASPLSDELGIIVRPDPASSPPRLPDREEILSFLRSHGAVILRGFPIELADFQRLSAEVAGGVTRGVVEGTEELQYHGEGCFLPLLIDVLWFYCITPAAQGGETKVCDGVSVLRGLSAGTREFFRGNPLVYEFSIPRGTWKPLLVLLNSRRLDPSDPMLSPASSAEAAAAFRHFGIASEPESADSVTARYEIGAIRRTQWGGEEAFVNTLLHALDPTMAKKQSYKLTTPVPPTVVAEVREVTDRETVWLRWEALDLVAIDNSRVMHGRRSYVPPRKILAVNGRLRDGIR